MYVQINIGRNYNTSNRKSLDMPPLTLSPLNWESFVNETMDALRYAAKGSERPSIEVHYGKGDWSGVGEESAHVSSFHAEGWNLDDLRMMIEDLRFTYSQDAIALIIGSELIEA